jgi:hypothetical protein
MTASIRKALAIPAHRATGTIQDVVILKIRSWDRSH